MIEGKGRRIIVVDDEPMLRNLVSDRLNALGYESWPAANAFEAKALVAARDPDALIVDIDLGAGPNGLELIQAIARTNPNLGFVLLTNFLTSPWEMSIVENLGYVKKGDVSNFSILTSVLEEVLLNLPHQARAGASPHSDQLASLTKHQLSVLALVANGLSNKEIATKQGASIGAVEQTLKRIYVELNLESKSNMSKRVSASRIFMQSRGPKGSLSA